MRRLVVTSTATLAGVILLLSLKPHDGGSATTAKVISSGGSAPSAAPSSGSAAASAPTSRSVTGDAADTRYGAVQVQVTLDGKKITRIDVIRYPDESGRDREINSYALPQLNQEALAAQTAQIDVVSGATYTSDGYTRSLQSALDKAGR